MSGGLVRGSPVVTEVKGVKSTVHTTTPVERCVLLHPSYATIHPAEEKVATPTSQ